MPSQYSPRTWVKSALGIGLLISATLFDGGSAVIGVILNDTGPNWGAQAASADHTSLRLLKAVLPGADSFSEKEGEVPVYKAYRTDPTSGEETLIGYAFVTPDFPPEANGDSGPIDTLVGIDLQGKIVGLKSIYYRESLRYTWGDFLSDPKFVNQFIGKSATDGFRIRKDIDGISKATISSRVVSQGVRQSVRAVTKAYLR